MEEHKEIDSSPSTAPLDTTPVEKQPSHPEGDVPTSTPVDLTTPTGAAVKTVSASAVTQKPESKNVGSDAGSQVATAVSVGSSTSGISTKRNAVDASHPQTKEGSTNIGYSSAITMKQKSAGTPRQSRLSLTTGNSRTPRKVISDACKRTEPSLENIDRENSAFFGPTGICVNAQYKTIPEEYSEYCSRNGISLNYRGPVFVVEDVCVPCQFCGSPVDPVRRVPVGSLFFHEACLHCYLCGRRTGAAGLYIQVDRQAVCSDCAGRGYELWVPRQETVSRGMVYSAIRSNPYAAIDAHDRGIQERQRRLWEGLKRKSAAGAPIKAVNMNSTLNKASVPGALPPSLTISNVHNRRNTGARSFMLMERQQYYTQSDRNMIITVPDAAVTSPSKAAKRQIHSAAQRYGITDKGHT